MRSRGMAYFDAQRKVKGRAAFRASRLHAVLCPLWLMKII
jgi:hypothetical protein